MNLESIFENPGMAVPIGLCFSLNEDDTLFSCPISVTGEIRNRSGIVTLEADFSTELSFDCDRCATPSKTQYRGKIAQTFVKKLSTDEDSNLVVLPDAQLDLTETVREELYLQLPSKLLCEKDCKGLCSNCGTNLNNGECGCKKQIDPRLAALLPLMDTTD